MDKGMAGRAGSPPPRPTEASPSERWPEVWAENFPGTIGRTNGTPAALSPGSAALSPGSAAPSPGSARPAPAARLLSVFLMLGVTALLWATGGSHGGHHRERHRGNQR
jgi:hypothetical protein